MKKIILGLICCLTVLSLATGCGNNKSSDNNKDTDNNKNKDVEVSKITGKVKLTKSFEGYSEATNCGRYYFTLKNESNLIVVDVNGKTVASGVSSYRDPQCFDDGTIMINSNKKGESYSSYKYSVWRNNKEIYSFENHLESTMFYENDILYYSDGSYTKAYNLKTNKELWTTKDYGNSPIALDKVVVLNSNKRNTIVDKKTGETIATSSNDKDIYASYSNYYVKTNKEKGTTPFLEVYDYDSNLISTLDTVSNNNCSFKYILSNGYYVIYCNDNSEFSGYSLYNFNSKPIKQGLDTFDYESSRVVKNSNAFTSINILDNKDISVFEASKYSSAPSLIVYNDGTIIDYYTPTDSWSFGLGVGNTGYWADTEQRTFVLGVNERYGNEYILMNFLTGNNVKISDNDIGDLMSKEMWGGKYIALNTNNKYIFYNDQLSKLDYETDKSLYSIVDEWLVLQQSNCERLTCDPKFYIANILTGEEKEISLDIDNSRNDIFIQINRNGIITKKGDIYNLYQFN